MSEEKANSKNSRDELRKERAQLRQERLDRKLEFAKDNNTRVVRANSNDVITLINLLRQTDVAIDRIRNNIGGRVDYEDGIQIIRRFEDATLEIDSITQDALKLTGSNYFAINSITAIRERKNETKSDKKDKTTKSENVA